MKITQVQIELEKRVSDGNYGSVRASVQLTAGVEPGEDGIDVLRELLAVGHARVILELRNSENLAVRRAVNPKPRTCAECKLGLTDDDVYEHAACTEIRSERERKQREEREAEYRKQREEREAAYRKDHEERGTPEHDDEDDEDDPL